MSQRTVEEYVEAIGALEERESPVSTSAIAQSLGLSLASVSEMLRRLSEKGLIEYTPYGGASLTEEGRRRFIRLTRRHRLWEVFLNQHLGIGWEDVYQHACSLEHATSDLVAEKLAKYLDNPEVCPHGSPIPGGSARRARTSGTLLADLEAGQEAELVSVIMERDPEFLRYLTSLGMTPGARLKVLEKAPFAGPLTVAVNDISRAVGREAASLIVVKKL